MAETQSGDIRPTIFLGLGGTGKEVLLRLRRKFYERLRAPGLPCVRYLWIDTDTRDVDAQGAKLDEIFEAVRFREEEQVGLLQGRVGDELGKVFTNPEQWKHIHSWLHDEVKRYGAEISDGAGGVRAVGRLTFFHNYAQRVSSAINQTLEAASNHTAITETQQIISDLSARMKATDSVKVSTGTQVFLVCSVAGGTGCGTFLDALFYLRMLKAKGQSTLDNIHGILFLPNVYYGDPSGELAQRSYGNAYAALKELDFYSLRLGTDDMSGGDTDRSVDFEVEWQKNHPESIVGPPFSVAYLQEMKNEAGIALAPRSRHELFTMVAESLYSDFMPSAFATQKRSHYSNVAGFLSGASAGNVTSDGVELPQAFARRYAAFGMGKVEIPADAIRGACAANLAGDVLDWIDRKGDSGAVKRNTADDLAHAQVDGPGLRGRFGTAWKDEVRAAVSQTVRAVNVSNASAIPKLEASLRELENQQVRAEGTDSTRWGSQIDAIRRKTPMVSSDVRSALTDWLQKCVEAEARGLNMTLDQSGYLRHGAETLRRLYQPEAEGSKPEFDAAKERVAADAKYWEERRRSALQQLSLALRSTAVQVLGGRAWTVEKLTERLLKAEEQYLLAKVEECLLDEAKKVAKAGVDFLQEKRVQMESYQRSLEVTRKRFRDRGEEFLNFSSGVLLIRLFDRNKDWDHYYRLDQDDEGRGKSINASREYRTFLEQSISAKASLLDLIDLHRRSASDADRRLDRFCEDRFWRDFETHPRQIDVLEHGQFQARRQQIIEQLVRAAIPMMRVDVTATGASLKTSKLAYLGVAPVEDDTHRDFVRDVTALLSRAGYTTLSIHSNGRRDEVSLYLVNYAFPLPSLPVVTNECHDAYVDFYASLRRGAAQRNANIELHLSKTWEGKFDDLKFYSDEEGRKIKEARSVLLFGGILKVVTPSEARGRVQFGVETGAPHFRTEFLGDRRGAVETLRTDHGQRQMLLGAVTNRERSLTAEQLTAYYWAIQYLRFSADFARGTPEATLLDMKLDGTKSEPGLMSLLKSKEVDTSKLRVEGSIDKDKAEFAKAAAGESLDWSTSRPVLRHVDIWTKPSAMSA